MDEAAHAKNPGVRLRAKFGPAAVLEQVDDKAEIARLRQKLIELNQEKKTLQRENEEQRATIGSMMIVRQGFQNLLRRTDTIRLGVFSDHGEAPVLCTKDLALSAPGSGEIYDAALQVGDLFTFLGSGGPIVFSNQGWKEDRQEEPTIFQVEGEGKFVQTGVGYKIKSQSGEYLEFSGECEDETRSLRLEETAGSPYQTLVFKFIRHRRGKPKTGPKDDGRSINELKEGKMWRKKTLKDVEREAKEKALQALRLTAIPNRRKVKTETFLKVKRENYQEIHSESGKEEA